MYKNGTVVSKQSESFLFLPKKMAFLQGYEEKKYLKLLPK